MDGMMRVKKCCVKCGRTGQYRPRERHCRRQNFGPRSYLCWGIVIAVPRRQRLTAGITKDSIAHGLRKIRVQLDEAVDRWADDVLAGSDELEEVLVAERGRAHRAKAAKAKVKEQAHVKALSTRVKRLQTALKKRLKKVTHLARLSAMTDAQVQAVRERAQHAAHVQKVRRRLLGKGDHETPATAALA